MKINYHSLIRVVGWFLFSLVSWIVLNIVLLYLISLVEGSSSGVTPTYRSYGLGQICGFYLLLCFIPLINILYLRVFIYTSYKKYAKPAIDILLSPVYEKLEKTGHPWMILLLGILVIGLLLNSLFFIGIYSLFNPYLCYHGSDADCGMGFFAVLVMYGPICLIIFIWLNFIILLSILSIPFIYGRQGQNIKK